MEMIKGLLQDGWMSVVGVICILYIVFGSESKVKICSFIIIFAIALIEYEKATHALSQLLK